MTTLRRDHHPRDLNRQTMRQALGALAKNDVKIKDVKLLGAKNTTSWKQDESGLVIQPPGLRGQPDFAAVYEVTVGRD